MALNRSMAWVTHYDWKERVYRDSFLGSNSVVLMSISRDIFYKVRWWGVRRRIIERILYSRTNDGPAPSQVNFSTTRTFVSVKLSTIFLAGSRCIQLTPTLSLQVTTRSNSRIASRNNQGNIDKAKLQEHLRLESVACCEACNSPQLVVKTKSSNTFSRIPPNSIRSRT
jgi:hypothetical protein